VFVLIETTQVRFSKSHATGVGKALLMQNSNMHAANIAPTGL
jgi:hypothetical protein